MLLRKLVWARLPDERQPDRRALEIVREDWARRGQDDLAEQRAPGTRCAWRAQVDEAERQWRGRWDLELCMCTTMEATSEVATVLRVHDGGLPEPRLDLSGLRQGGAHGVRVLVLKLRQDHFISLR